MRKLILIALCAAIPVAAQITAGTLWEVQPTVGVDTNGGGFSPGIGTKTVTAATDLTVDVSVSGRVTSATHNFVAGDVGKYLNITAQSSGVAWTFGYYRILSVGSNAANLDRAPAVAGTATTATYNLWDGIDYSDVGATPQVNINNSTITATTTGVSSDIITFATGYTTALTDVGNIVHCTGGTNITPGMYVITSVGVSAPPGGTWTVTGAQTVTTGGGAGAALVCRMGGSLATIAGISPSGGGYVASNHVFIKATGTLSVSAATTISIGAVPTDSVPYGVVEGYTTTRGDGGRATIQRSSGTAFSLLSFSGGGWRVRNLILDGNGGTSVSGISFTGAQGSIANSIVKGFLTTGIVCGAASCEVLNNEVTTAQASCTQGISATSTAYIRWNWIHDMPCPGIAITNGSVEVVQNLITNITGASSDCVSDSVWNGTNLFLNNTLSGCGRDGFRITAASASAGFIINNIIASATGTGLDFTAGAGLPSTNMWKGNFYYNNGTNRTNADDEGVTNIINGISPNRASSGVNADVLLTANPFTNTAGNDYSLNATAGGGAAVKNAATPGLFPSSSTTGFPSGGAVQPTVSGASCSGFATSYVQ